MALSEILCTALGSAVVFLVGRAILAWLPPGEIGSHRPAKLATTWAASHVLGCAAIAAAGGLGALLGTNVPLAAVGAGAGLLLAARALSLPAALRPRHEVQQELPTRAATIAWIAAVSLALASSAVAPLSRTEGMWAVRAQAWLSQGWPPGFEGPATREGALALTPMMPGSLALLAWPLGVVTELAARVQLFAFLAACLLLCEHALALTRRAVLPRRLVLIALAAALVPAADPEQGDLALAALCALCLSGLCAWTRRADARGLALAVLGLCSMPLARPGGWVIGLAGLFALLAASARSSVLRALGWSLAAALALMLPWPLAAFLRRVPLLGDEPLAALASDWALNAELELAWWIAPVWIALGASMGPAFLHLFRRPAPEQLGLRAADADRPRRDLAALALFLATLLVFSTLLAFAAGVPLALVAKAWAPGLLVAAAPLAALLAGRALLPAESSA